METHKQKHKGKMLSTLGGIANLRQQARKAGYRVKDFAQRLGKKIRWLERHFQEEKDKTPHDWLNDLRLAAAKAKLPNGGNISAIAIELGFVGVSQFSNWFLRNTRIRPSEFVKAIGKA